MAQENITINLPVSGEIALMRSFIPHKVARAINSTFLGKQKVDLKKIKAANDNGDQPKADDVLAEMELTGDDLALLSDKLVNGLVIQLGEHYAATESLTNYLDELPEADFKLLSEKANAIYSNYQETTSPKS